MQKSFLKIGFLIAAAFLSQISLAQIGVTESTYYNPTPAGTMSTSTFADTLSYSDTSYYRQNFTLKKYFRALGHKDTIDISHMFFGDAILPGTAQLYNKQAWKIPIVYGAIGGCIGGAAYYNGKWKSESDTDAKKMRDILIMGAVASYWGQLLDGVVSYKSSEAHLPARASLYSALLPGLGQAYNGDYWHIPLYYAGFMISGYCWAFNQKQYKRYQNLYIDYYEGTYDGPYSPDNLAWYRDAYRRNRDYSVLCTIGIYILNIIDANVFAHFKDFDVSDDISVHIQPAIIEPITPYNSLYTNVNYGTQFGISMNINF